MKSILIIGMGRFGRHLAQHFYDLKNEVLAVDKDEERINAVLEYVTGAQIGDSTQEAFIHSLGVRNFDICVVAFGSNFQSSIETTALLKDLGAKFVIARATRDVHAKFLLRNGADKTVYVEKEMAYRLAKRYSMDNVFECVEMTPDYSMYEIAVPEGWVGKSILQKAVYTKYHISILAIKTADHITPLPKPDYVFQGNETLMVIGHNEDLKRFSRV